MDGHYEGRIIFLLGRFVFVVVVGAFLSICTPQAQKVGGFVLKTSHILLSTMHSNGTRNLLIQLYMYMYMYKYFQVPVPVLELAY